MDGTLSNIVDEWIQEGLSSCREFNPISIHISELLSKKIKNEDVVNISRIVYLLFIKKIKYLGDPIQPMLYIPLISDSITATYKPPKDKEEFFDQINYFEPPSLYMLSWQRPRKTVIVEEFVSPIQFTLFEKYKKNIHAYFREHRYAIDIKMNWEFNRGIYFEYYPDGVITETD